MKTRRITRALIAITCTTISFSTVNVGAITEDATVAKIKSEIIKNDRVTEYVVITDSNKEDVDKIVDKNELNDEELEINSSYGLKIKATNKQIREIENKNNVIVSENVTFNASSKKQLKYKLNMRKRNSNSKAEWNIKMINGDTAKIEKNNSRVKIAILDSGIDYTSEIDVVERVNLIKEEKNVDTPFEDTTGHGTSIAGIIAAKDNGLGITGINPNAKIYSARILDDNNQAPLSRVVEGIYWAIEKKSI